MLRKRSEIDRFTFYGLRQFGELANKDGIFLRHAALKRHGIAHFLSFARIMQPSNRYEKDQTESTRCSWSPLAHASTDAVGHHRHEACKSQKRDVPIEFTPVVYQKHDGQK